MAENQYELIVSQGKRPWFKTLVAAVLFTLMFFLLAQFLSDIYYNGYQEDHGKLYGNYIQWACYCLVGGIHFSMMKTVLIDVDQNKLISRYFIGPFWRDFLTAVPKLEYVSVFKDAKDRFQVNLWYKGNKHYKMYAFDEPKPAFTFASMVAEKLHIDVFDATTRGDFKWVEKHTSNSD